MRLIDVKLSKVKELLYQAAALALKATDIAVNSYVYGVDRSNELYSVASELRRLYDSISDLVIEIIARYQPVASDLRFLKVALEASYGFFRFGRYAYDIGSTIALVGRHECDPSRVIRVAEVTKKMLSTSVRMLLESNTSGIEEVHSADDEVVDREYLEALRAGLNMPSTCSILETLVLRYLERMSDHAVYIADAVYYMVTGRPWK